ncbi:MAG TPA: S53 family peptidase [Polyangiaceae bacterium]
MRIHRSIIVLGATWASLSAVACSGGSAPSDAPTPPSQPTIATAASLTARAHAPVCPGPAAPGDARCHARLVVDAAGNPDQTSGPSGYGPPDLQSAYALTAAASTGGAGKTIALVDAYDYPNAEADLAVYRAQYGMPPCTKANGCFRKVNQDGLAGSLPRVDTGWSQEAALDLDMASAICPACSLLLVEARSSSFTNLAAAVDTAVALGADVVSNSYGGGEFSTETSVESHYNHPGVSITVSSGDGGFGVEFPAASRWVTAVGGTTLTTASGARGWRETAWSGAGSGCSAYVPKPAWQSDPDCARRTVADVSAVADPNTGVAVYWTQKRRGGWLVFGGTSVGAPLVGAAYALAGNGAGPSYPYAHASSLFDVVEGSNGTCGGSYLCTATAGYDGPTGLGTPNGTGAL